MLFSRLLDVEEEGCQRIFYCCSHTILRIVLMYINYICTYIRYALENAGERAADAAARHDTTYRTYDCTIRFRERRWGLLVVLYAILRTIRGGTVRSKALRTGTNKVANYEKRFFLFSARLLRNSKRRTMPDRPENDDDLRLRSRRRRKTRWRRGLLQVRDRGKDVGDTDDRGVFEVRNLTLFSLDTLRVRFPVTIGPFDQWWAGIFTFSWTVLIVRCY